MKKILQRLKQLFKNKKALIFVFAGIVVLGLVAFTVFGGSLRAGDSGDISSANINPSADQIASKSAVITTTEPSEKAPAASSAASTAATSATAATRATRAASTRSTQTTTLYIPFATAIPAAVPADYSAQWNAGYLVAIDNPDTSYACPHVELSDEDRDLLERLCMGEFGSGGFVGASLIAQAVKDAMCFDGYTSVADVIKYCRYDGDTNRGTNDDCRKAVRYVFDDDGDAVQHRIMYMYNPYLVQSAFHESENYILSYQGVRFFDRWNY